MISSNNNNNNNGSMKPEIKMKW